MERSAGRVVSLQPGTRYDAQVMLEVAVGVENVADVMAEIGQIHDAAAGTVHLQPHSDFGAQCG